MELWLFGVLCAIGSLTESEPLDHMMAKIKNTPDFYAGGELSALREAENYYTAIMSQFTPYLGKKVIEVGAGIGTFSNFLLARPNITELTLVEPADNLFPWLEQEFCRNERVKLFHGCLHDVADSLSSDSIVMVNVLEHSKDDKALLRTVHRILSPGGVVLLFVPALPRLYGSLDEAFGHFRRYTKASLALSLEDTGFRIELLCYFNFLGIVTWFFAGKILKRKSIRASDAQIYDRWVMPWVNRFERKWEPPIGQSLIAIARK